MLDGLYKQKTSITPEALYAQKGINLRSLDRLTF